MKFSPGSRWKSAVCDTEIVVVRPPSGDILLSCGGAPMVPFPEDRPGGVPTADQADGTLLGKRYGDDISHIELLCTKGGSGSLSIDDRRVMMREVKRLPSSD